MSASAYYTAFVKRFSTGPKTPRLSRKGFEILSELVALLPDEALRKRLRDEHASRCVVCVVWWRWSSPLIHACVCFVCAVCWRIALPTTFPRWAAIRRWAARRTVRCARRRGRHRRLAPPRSTPTRFPLLAAALATPNRAKWANNKQTFSFQFYFSFYKKISVVLFVEKK